MLLIIWIVFFFIGLIKRDSKIVSVMQILFISILFAINDGNPDQYSYINTYNNLVFGNSSILIGNILTNIIFKVCGVFRNYNIAIFFITAVCLIIIYKGISFFTNQTAFVLSMYLIAPFTIDATQIKNFIAMSVMVYFFKYLYLAMTSEKKVKYLLIYSIGCVIATSVHFSFAISFLFMFIVLLNDKNSILRIIILGLVFSLIIFNFDNILNLISFIDLPVFVIIRNKITQYSSTYNHLYYISRARYTLEFFIVVFIAFIYAKKRINVLDQNTSLYYKFITRLTLIALIVFPLMKYSIEFYRMQRNLLIMYYIFFANMNPVEEKRSEKPVLIVSPYVVLSTVISFMYLIFDSIFGNFQNVFRVLFRI